jgi:hypothetical protein
MLSVVIGILAWLIGFWALNAGRDRPRPGWHRCASCGQSFSGEFCPFCFPPVHPWRLQGRKPTPELRYALWLRRHRLARRARSRGARGGPPRGGGAPTGLFRKPPIGEPKTRTPVRAASR